MQSEIRTASIVNAWARSAADGVPLRVSTVWDNDLRIFSEPCFFMASLTKWHSEHIVLNSPGVLPLHRAQRGIALSAKEGYLRFGL